MKLRFLGNTGIKVSEICFGTMTFGGVGSWKSIGEVGEKEAQKMVNLAMENGINFFDTANIYSEGSSEELLGKALGDRRTEAIIATKVRFPSGTGPNQVGLSRHHIMEACNASLKRLNTDYIDLYQAHLFDSRTPLEETLKAFDDLVRQGKVRYIGCSNFTAWQLMKALSISDKHGWERFISNQAYYSLMARELELEIVPLCQDQGLGILVWSPLAGGFLTGKYRRNEEKPKGSRRAEQPKPFIQFDEEKGYALIEEMEKLAKKYEASITQVALNYLLCKQGVTSVIIGVRNEEQLLEDLKAVEWELSKEDVALLDKMTEPPRLYPYWMQKMGVRD